MHKWSFRIQPLTNAKSFQMILAEAHLRDKARLTAVEGGRRGDGPLPFRTGSHLTLTCRQPAPIVPHTAQVTCPSLAWEEGKCIHCQTWNGWEWAHRGGKWKLSISCSTAVWVLRSLNLFPGCTQWGLPFAILDRMLSPWEKQWGTVLSTLGPKSLFDSSHLTYKRSI